MPHAAMEATSLKPEPKLPQSNPLKQEPPTRAAFHVPILLYNKKIFEPSALLWGKNSPKPPYCKGGLQERDAPMYQLEYEGAEYRCDAKAPTSKPQLQEPPTRA